MVNYLLTVFSDFEENGMAKELAISLTPVVDSPHLKFQYTKGAMIFHFATEVDHLELHDFIVGVTYGISNCFILSVLNDKVSVHMPKDDSNHLFDLENQKDNVEIKLKSNRTMSEDDELEDDFSVALLLDEIKSKVSKPSLDSLLEKIKSKGIDSLTPFEKDVLNEYSNN